MTYIGVDIQKFISTAVVINDDEKIVAQYIDFETTPEGLDKVFDNYDPADCRIVIENLTASHRVYHHLKPKGFTIYVLHTGDGCVTEISKSKFKTDLEDATKLATICKDISTGRRKYRLAHIPSEKEMRAKSLCRVLNQFSEDRDKYNLRIQELMNLNGFTLPGRLKSFISKTALKYIRSLGHEALARMSDAVEFLNEQIELSKKELESLYSEDQDAKNLMSVKGISIQTAATILSSIDGIERFDTPEKLVSHFGLDLTIHSSGGKESKRHISKQGDPLVRKLMANVVAKHPIYYPNSALAEFYKRMKEKMPHWKAITAAMRKLTCIIWAMLTRHEVYRCS